MERTDVRHVDEGRWALRQAPGSDCRPKGLHRHPGECVVLRSGMAIVELGLPQGQPLPIGLPESRPAATVPSEAPSLSHARYA